MPVESWFSTPIYYNQVSDVDSIQKELSTALESVEFSRVGFWGDSTHRVSDPSFNTSIIADYNLTEFDNEIRSHVSSYTRLLNSPKERPFRIAASWFTKTSTKEYTRLHNHSWADISGVYYYKTNGVDGSISFLSPTPSLSSMIFANFRDTVTYDPAVGKIILFPGWLYHVVGENDTADERISVSFNIYFDR